MSDIASSLEQEFTMHAQADRDAYIAELKRLEAAGRGSVEITPHSVGLPVLFGGAGAAVLYGALSSRHLTTMEVLLFSLLGLALLSSLWMMLGPREPCYTLCEEGIRVRGGDLTPWDSISDWRVNETRYSFLPISVALVLNYEAGFTPPPLRHPFSVGVTRHNRKTGEYVTDLTLYTGPKGMSVAQLPSASTTSMRRRMRAPNWLAWADCREHGRDWRAHRSARSPRARRSASRRGRSGAAARDHEGYFVTSFSTQGWNSPLSLSSRNSTPVATPK